MHSKGVSPKNESPSELILNWQVDFNKHDKVEFGDCVQTHEEHDKSMATHTIGAIMTIPTCNIQGRYYFILLDTGRHMNHYKWTALPMPTEVIQQVHHLAHHTKANKSLWHTNKHSEDLDVLYADLDHDEDDNPIGDDPDATT